MTTGKVKTLFTDKEKTEALFPRTKLSAVSDENGVGLDALMEHLAYTDEKSNDIIINTVDADSLNGIPAKDWAQKSFVTSEIAKAQFSGGGSGDIDLSGFATKDDLSNIDFPVDSVNGKTGAVTLSASDVGAVPTARKVNGKALSSDITLSASDVSAVPTTRTVNGKKLSSNITLSASDVGAAAVSSVGTNKVFNKLTDIGITTFPTTMKTIASSMPNNSTLMLDSRDIIAGGTHEISDLGINNAGMYMFMRGNSNARVTMLHIYGSTSASTSYMNYGCYAATSNVVTWIRATKTTRVKLWENAKISNAFKAQTVSVDLSDYDGVEILYYVDSTTNIYQSTGFIKKGLPSVMYYVTADVGNRVHRTFTVNASGIVFDTATASSGISGGGLCKPYQIYGIKGVY